MDLMNQYREKRWAPNKIYCTFPFILEFRAGKKCTVIKCSLVITFVGGKIWGRACGKIPFFFLLDTVSCNHMYRSRLLKIKYTCQNILR